MDIITSLDIGSQTIKAMAGQVDDQGTLQIIGAVTTDSEGVTKGVVTSIEDTVSSIAQALERLERMVGVPVDSVIVNVSGSHINVRSSRGVIAVAKPDGEIMEDDVERVIEAAKAVAVPPNYEIIHVIPKRFVVDDQNNIKDPIGMTGVRLEADIQLIEGQSSHIRNLAKCVYRTNRDIETIAYSVLATAEAVLNKKQKEIGVALVDIGASTTKVVVYEEGDLIHTRVLPIGAGHITADIAIALRTSIDVAEKIKLAYGSLFQKYSKTDTINIADFIDGSDEDIIIPLSHIQEVIEARVGEIYELVDKEFKSIKRSGMLPGGVVLTGGGAKLPGMVDFAKNVFRLPAFLGEPTGIRALIDKVNDPQYSTALGLIIWSLRNREVMGSSGGSMRRSAKGGFGSIMKTFSHLIKFK